MAGMEFAVPKGEIFGLLGPSGTGKSTLQKILIGMLPTYQGSAIIVNGSIWALDSPYDLIMSRGTAKVAYTWPAGGEHWYEIRKSLCWEKL